jgi:hypothetical protein
VIETALGDEGEIAGQHFAAPVALVGRFQPIAEIDSLIEMRCCRRMRAGDERIG